MRKKKKTEYSEEIKVNIITSSTCIEGNINCQSSIRFDGSMKGEIHADKRIVIGEKAIIEGQLFAKDIEIHGKIKGDCKVKNSITLSPTANYTGNIFTGQLIIQTGAVFNGKSEMTIEKKKDFIPDKKIQISSISKTSELTSPKLRKDSII